MRALGALGRISRCPRGLRLEVDPVTSNNEENGVTSVQLEERARVIIDAVLAKDESWGKNNGARGAENSTRIISDDCRWVAHLRRGYEKGDDGELWDLVQVWAHGTHVMTAAFRDEGMRLPVYESGPWEPLFQLYNLPELPPRRPNMGTPYEM